MIFLIGSSNHHEINQFENMGLDYNVYPLNKALSYFSKRNIKKFICFTTILLYDQNKLNLPVDENQEINPYVNKYIFSKFLSEQIVEFYKDSVPSIIIRLSKYIWIYKIKTTRLNPYNYARYF